MGSQPPDSKRQRILRVLDALSVKNRRDPQAADEGIDGDDVVTVDAEPPSMGRPRPPSGPVSRRDVEAVRARVPAPAPRKPGVVVVGDIDAIPTDPEDEAEQVVVIKPPSESERQGNLRVLDGSYIERPLSTDGPGPGALGEDAPGPTPAPGGSPAAPDPEPNLDLRALDTPLGKTSGVPEPSRGTFGTIDAKAQPPEEETEEVKTEPEVKPELTFTRSRESEAPGAPAAPAPDSEAPIPSDRAPVPMQQARAFREAMAAREAAAIPHIEVVQISCRGDDPRLILHLEPESPRAAAFRVLRHRIAGTARVVAVSSALPREGKTTCAVNLAIALSEHEPTVLLEANTESPSIARMVGFSPPVCATMGYNKVVEALWPNLHILAVDPRTGRGSHIAGELLRSALEDLQRAGYRHVVIDTPPILGHADVNLIQEVADGVIISTTAGRSKAATIQQAIDQLTPEKLLGAVLLEG